MSGDLLRTKLYIPQARPTRVARPRLVAQIGQGLRTGRQFTLVSAPAGFGKTTLIADWLAHYPDDAGRREDDPPGAAWLALDDGDNDPTRFLSYLMAALQQIDQNIGNAAAVMLHSPQSPPMESMLTSLLNDLAKMVQGRQNQHPAILVLDDYHLIAAPPIHNAVTFLLENLPPCLHLVLVSRSDPPLPLSRWRVRGQLAEIRQADLRFTAVETAVFLNKVMGLSLTASQVDTLEARTEGWIAGLQLAALSMQGRDDVTTFVETFGGSHRFVMDYLAEEVIQGQPSDLQEFILQTSILKRLCGSLCGAVTCQAKSQDTLEQLETSNLFLIPLDDDRTWFRYHHLFADMMAGRLHRSSPEKVPELHQRAAGWFRQNSLFAEAVEHALLGNDLDLAAEIVESQALAQLKAGNLATLAGWLVEMPPHIILERPRLGIALAWVDLLTGRLEHIEEYLSAAERNLDGLSDSNALQGQIAAIRTYYAARLGQLDQAVAQAGVARELLPKDDLSVHCVVTFVLGGVHYLRQELPLAVEVMKEASQLGQQAGNTHVAVSALSSAADLLRQLGQLVDAEKAYLRALQIGSDRSNKPLPMAASVYSGLAALRLNQKAFDKSREYALTSLELGESWPNADSQVSCYLTLAQLEQLEGHPDQAEQALDKAKSLAANHQLGPGLAEQIADLDVALHASPFGDETDPGELPELLNEHELKVLRLVAAGLSNREVGAELYLSVNTVKWHLKHAYEKLDVHSRVAAVTRAQELGLI